MKVSVIMSVYNGEKFLKEAINSILNQTFRDFEFIIVNDGSTDSTKEILEQYSDPRIQVFHQSNQGCAIARNRAIAQAKGQYIAIMDSDDVSLPDRLIRTVVYLDKHPKVVLVGGSYIVKRENTNAEKIIRLPTEDEVLRRCLLRYDPFKDPTNLIRKDAFEKAGGYKLGHGFDYELYSRLANMGKLANIQEPLALIRRHDKQFFRMGYTPEEHRKRRLKIRWLTLWRLKPPFFLFVQTIMWLSFESCVHFFPANLRHLVPESLRGFFKDALPPKA
jgi:glycosyltransferase involved in cell wall biosynthesis